MCFAPYTYTEPVLWWKDRMEHIYKFFRHSEKWRNKAGAFKWRLAGQIWPAKGYKMTHKDTEEIRHTINLKTCFFIWSVTVVKLLSLIIKCVISVNKYNKKQLECKNPAECVHAMYSNK